MRHFRLVLIIIAFSVYSLCNMAFLHYQLGKSPVEKTECPPSQNPINHPSTNPPSIKPSSINSSSTAKRSLPLETPSIDSAVPPFHRLAVLVPFRNRWEELIEFVPHIHKFLNKQNVSHEILIINQVDKHRFNRAMLLNVGYVLTNTTCDYLVMHDVDLLPLNDDIKYFYPSDGPFHISSPQLHPLYHYEKYVGGILMLTREHYRKINGMTNMFWGWGREDDEFYLRMKEAGLKIHRPSGITTGYKTFKHNHDKKERKRDMKSYGTQNQLSRKRDKRTGLSTLKYTLVSVTNITINHSPLTLANVELHCDYEITPFCDHPS